MSVVRRWLYVLVINIGLSDFRFDVICKRKKAENFVPQKKKFKKDKDKKDKKDKKKET